MKTKISIGLVAIMLLAVVGAIAMPVSASLHQETAYASYQQTVWDAQGDDHIVLAYRVPHDTLTFPLPGLSLCPSPCYRPYVGGVNLKIAAIMPDHTNPQQWDYWSRTQISASQDTIKLLIPKSYIYPMDKLMGQGWCRSTIYIKYFRR